MQYVELLGRVKWGGVCTNCGKDSHADNLRRILAEYEDKDGSSMIEPFVVCKDCLKELQSQ